MGYSPENFVAPCGCIYQFGHRVVTCANHGEPTQDDYEEVPDSGT